MKQLWLFLLVCSLASSVSGQSGRVRISFAGFQCIRETWDDILQTDGKGDEVYFNFGFTLANRQGATLQKYEKRTSVYGDNTGPFSNRINAGSAVDIFGGARGGIKAGDNYNCMDIIGEYNMNDGDILTIVPTAWEYDPVADNMNSFTSTMGGLYNSINQKVAPVMAGLHLLAGDLGGVIYHATNFGISKIKAGGDQGELGRPGTRPIGMEKYGDFVPELVVFNTKTITTICNSNYGYGQGVIAVNYDEVARGNNRDHGIYNILIKLEFTPSGPAAGSSSAPAPAGYVPPPSSSSTQNAPPPPSNTGGSYVPPPPASTTNTAPAQPKQLAATVNPKVINANLPVNKLPLNVTGIWVGNYGTGNVYNGYYCFRLNADGTMQVLGRQQEVVASGTYRFSNNQLTGTYIQPAGAIFSFSGMLDQQTMTGTYGKGTVATGEGGWKLTKQTTAISNLR